MSDILALKNGRRYSEDDVRRVVANCSKQRFALRQHPTSGQLQIRANQGHSMQASGTIIDCRSSSIAGFTHGPVLYSLVAWNE